MNPKEELCELPEWVKLVNKLLHSERNWEQGKRNFDRCITKNA
jgi:hypothetical protein